MEEISEDLIIAFALNSFFAIALMTFSINTIVNSIISAAFTSLIVGILILAVGLIEGYYVFSLYNFIKQNALQRIIDRLNQVSILNILFSSIILLIILGSLTVSYLVGELDLDTLALFFIYAIALVLGLGLTSGIFSWRAVKTYK